MRQRWRGIIRTAAVGGLLAAGLAPGAGAVAPGEAAPAFQLPGAKGEVVQLAALRGKWVYLDFWASWCGPCRQSFPWMGQMQSRYGAQGLQVVAVSVDARPEDARRFLAEVPAGFTVALDPQGLTPRQYAIKGMPTSVLIAPDGKVVFTHTSFRPEAQAELEQRIAQAMGTKR